MRLERNAIDERAKAGSFEEEVAEELDEGDKVAAIHERI